MSCFATNEPDADLVDEELKMMKIIFAGLYPLSVAARKRIFDHVMDMLEDHPPPANVHDECQRTY